MHADLNRPLDLATAGTRHREHKRSLGLKKSTLSDYEGYLRIHGVATVVCASSAAESSGPTWRAGRPAAWMSPRAASSAFSVWAEGATGCRSAGSI